MNIKIDKNVPIPTAAAVKDSKGLAKVLRDMEPGDSFPVERENGRRDTSKFANVRVSCKKHNLFVVPIPVEENGKVIDRYYKFADLESMNQTLSDCGLDTWSNEEWFGKDAK